jgi:hypothetical protein
MGQTQLSLIQNTLFDYAALDRETEVAARSDAALIKGLMKRTAEDVIEIGNALIRQKQALPGKFTAWIEIEFGWQERMAQRFVLVARTYGSDPSRVTGLSQLALMELAAPSTPPEVQAEVERRIAAGELVSGADVRTLKEQYNEVVAKALDLANTTDQVREENRDLLANAHRRANEEAQLKYGALVDDLKKRAGIAGETAAASMQSAHEDAAAHPEVSAVVVPFTPKDDGEAYVEPDPFGDDSSLKNVDLNDMSVGAHVIYGSLSSIDLAKTTPYTAKGKRDWAGPKLSQWAAVNYGATGGNDIEALWNFVGDLIIIGYDKKGHNKYIVAGSSLPFEMEWFLNLKRGNAAKAASRAAIAMKILEPGIKAMGGRTLEAAYAEDCSTYRFQTTGT